MENFLLSLLTNRRNHVSVRLVLGRYTDLFQDEHGGSYRLLQPACRESV